MAISPTRKLFSSQVKKTPGGIEDTVTTNNGQNLMIPKNDKEEGGEAKIKLSNLKTEIDALQEYVKDRHNVHQEIKRMILRIRAAYNLVESENLSMTVRSMGAVDKQKASGSFTSSSTQTEAMVPANHTLASVLTPLTTRSTTPSSSKRRRDTVEFETTGHSPRLKKTNRGLVIQRLAGVPPSVDEGTESEMTDTVPPDKEVWSIVNRKKKSRAKPDKPSLTRPRKIRPDAIVIGKVGELSYADILRKVKGDPSLKEIGENVARIRRTHKGEMLIELNKDTGKDKGTNFHLMVKNALGEQASVRSLSHEFLIECKDIDEVTSKEEIHEAMVQQFTLPAPDDVVVRSLRKAYGSTQIAIISLPAELALKILLVGKIKIGWTVCKLRELIRPLKCFKCLDFGHIAKDCTNNDRSDRCRRCGGTGHQAKDCAKLPSCMLCKGVDGVALEHISGSSRCPAYRRALNRARK